MEIIYIVHGVVQGVGYRNFVRNIAKRNGIRGGVRNVADGSVEIVAIGKKGNIEQFEAQIKISDKYGPQVMQVEKVVKASEDELAYEDFLIWRDKKA